MNVLITAIVPYIVPLILIVAGYIIHHVAVYIPAQQRAYIAMWAAKAVAYVEQQSAGKTNAEKKQLAMDTIVGFFKAFNLPAPNMDILSSFIEAAVNALNSATPVTVVPSTIAQSVDPHMAIDPPSVKRASL